MSKIELSVIMPALNEENNISDAVLSTLKALSDKKINGEIIVVNDGSTDQTEALVKNIIKNNANVRLINHIKPHGIGHSFLDGVKSASGDIVVMFPGDNENDPDDALLYIGLMKELDIIIPFVQNTEVRNRIRRLISSIYRFIVNMSFGINLNYTNGTVFYRRSILNNLQINSTGFFYQAELLIKLIRKGYLYAEVPNFIYKRNNGKSKAVGLKSLMNVMKNYLLLVYNIHILRVESQKRYRYLVETSVSYKKYDLIKRGE